MRPSRRNLLNGWNEAGARRSMRQRAGRLVAAFSLLALPLACSQEEGPGTRPQVSRCADASAALASDASIHFSEADAISSAERILLPLLATQGRSPLADVGDGSFTIEFWIRGVESEQIRPTQGYRSPGQRESDELDWVRTNIVMDRSVYHARYPVFGAGIHRDGAPGSEPDSYDRAVVRFGVRSGTIAGNGKDARYTLQGVKHVLDGEWHHIALVRDADRGRLAIYVDGVLDAESSRDGVATRADLSYPAGAEEDPEVTNPERSPFLVFGTEKHDLGSDSPGLRGWIDELRLWRGVRSAKEISRSRDAILDGTEEGLLASYRFEAGTGTTLWDDAQGPSAILEPRGGWLSKHEPWSSEGAPVGCP